MISLRNNSEDVFVLIHVDFVSSFSRDLVSAWLEWLRGTQTVGSMEALLENVRRPWRCFGWVLPQEPQED